MLYFKVFIIGILLVAGLNAECSGRRKCPPGEAGKPGDVGDVGDKGMKGAKGDPGKDGISGIQGPPGNRGPQGDKGEKGNMGQSNMDTNKLEEELLKIFKNDSKGSFLDELLDRINEISKDNGEIGDKGDEGDCNCNDGSIVFPDDSTTTYPKYRSA